MLRIHLVIGIGVTALAIPSVSPTPPAQQGVSVTFLANEGVMLSAEGHKVLIDALFLKYERGYAVPADSTLAALQRARAPFDSVDLVLVTHRHGDHFHPAPVEAHLRANPRAVLVTSQQVIDSLRAYGPAGALPAARLMSSTMRAGTRRRDAISGVAVELLGLPHGGHPRVEHIGYIVELGGRRVLHVGDADLSEATLAPLRLDTSRIDVALLPYWAVTGRTERRTIERWIRPRQIVAFHVGAREGAKAERAVRNAIPNAVTLVRSLETRRW
jgi:L-ascorbate metabolism protein UlaG (beta-lactamase superfamily)